MDIITLITEYVEGLLAAEDKFIEHLCSERCYHLGCRQQYHGVFTMEHARPKYIQYREKMCGSVYDMENGTFSTNNVLQAIAVYGQTHWYWAYDEAAMMGGPKGFPAQKNTYLMIIGAIFR